ncbi:hypothetical protein AZE42_06398 [Rhizopogon vesiculosus]|uniref:Cytochrome P450 n=1 Tax=Rhizopogon vesiculosus TaxID=180088 RepID=A0A1J8QYC4_9AGAM|nr:hypothetical protein AZE42_06398 [Rhizopogon vesiculosus]
MDAIGEAGFDVNFGCIDNNENALGRAYSNLLADIFGSRSDREIFFQGVLRYIPSRILEYLMKRSENPRIVRMREVGSLATSVARQMVKEKAEVLLQGKGSRDVFSLLVKANMDTDAKAKLTEEELIGQMRTIIFGGYDTTSTTISWGFLELARHPEIQSRFRAEIRETESTIHRRGDAEFTVADFDDMPYTAAVMEEILRFCPVGYHIYRFASQDDIAVTANHYALRGGHP